MVDLTLECVAVLKTVGPKALGVRIPHPPPPKLLERYNKKVVIGSPEKCWIWIGARVSKYGKSTYGSFAITRDYKVTAHRLAWVLAFGEIPEALYVLHKCDNPPCVNPEHLFLGTINDNNQDRTKKGRTRTRVTNNKLDAAGVEEVRQTIGRTKFLAAKYNCSTRTIRACRCGDTYK